MLAIIGKHQHGKTGVASLAKAKVEVKIDFLNKLSGIYSGSLLIFSSRTEMGFKQLEAESGRSGQRKIAAGIFWDFSKRDNQDAVPLVDRHSRTF